MPVFKRDTKDLHEYVNGAEITGDGKQYHRTLFLTLLLSKIRKISSNTRKEKNRKEESTNRVKARYTNPNDLK